MSKFWHSFGSVGVLLLTALSPQLQTTIGGAFMAHPAIGMGIVTAWSVIGHLLPSPVAVNPQQ